MLRYTPLVAALALSLAVVAGCGEQNRTTDRAAANPAVPPTTPSAPTVSSSSSRGSDAAAGSATTPSGNAPASPSPGTPETHAGTPQPSSPPAPTARDTTSNQPQSDLSKAEEAHSMPKSGQVNNYNSPAYEPKRGAGGNQ